MNPALRTALPNVITASNLFCGTLALIMVWQHNLYAVLGLLAAALALDFADGMVARVLKVSSPVGKELDSLADVVSFGVVPGMIMARLIREASGGMFPDPLMWIPGQDWLWMTGLLIPIFSALRLARFNLDHRQEEAFFGLPTPSNTMFVLGLWMLIESPSLLWQTWLGNPWVLTTLTLLFCWLLIAEVRLLSLKFHNLGWKGNELRYLLVGGSLIFLFVMGWAGLSFIILYYLALSLANNLLALGNLRGKQV